MFFATLLGMAFNTDSVTYKHVSTIQRSRFTYTDVKKPDFAIELLMPFLALSGFALVVLIGLCIVLTADIVCLIQLARGKLRPSRWLWLNAVVVGVWTLMLVLVCLDLRIGDYPGAGIPVGMAALAL